MENSLKEFGYIVLMEPVSDNVDDATERPHENIAQRMMIRSANYYKKIFRRLKMNVKHTRRNPKSGRLTHDIFTYVI